MTDPAHAHDTEGPVTQVEEDQEAEVLVYNVYHCSVHTDVETDRSLRERIPKDPPTE